MPDSNRPVVFGASHKVQDLFRTVYDRLEVLEQNSVYAGYGAIAFTSGGSNPGASIGTVPEDVTYYDAEIWTPARDCTVDPVTGVYTVTRKGPWELTFTYSITHDVDPARTRTFTFSLENETQATRIVGPIQQFAGINSDGTQGHLTIPFVADEAALGDTIKIQVVAASGVDVLTNIRWDTCTGVLRYVGTVLEGETS